MPVRNLNVVFASRAHCLHFSFDYFAVGRVNEEAEKAALGVNSTKPTSPLQMLYLQSSEASRVILMMCD